jgi:hypothetical protein
MSIVLLDSEVTIFEEMKVDQINSIAGWDHRKNIKEPSLGIGGSVNAHAM